jgi:hypothetical protein
MRDTRRVSYEWRFARDANVLTASYRSGDQEALMASLDNMAISYESIVDTNYHRNFCCAAPIRDFLAEAASDLLGHEAISISLTNFIDSLCRLSFEWVHYFL